MRKSKTKNTFVRALEIICDTQEHPEDFRLMDFLLRLAAEAPEHLVSAYDMSQKGFRIKLRNLIKSGRKIQAIKLYREHTGRDLKTAKEMVEKIAAEIGYPL